MNDKGQLMVGGMIVVAIGIIVALTLLSGGISGGVGQMTSKSTIVNETITLSAKNGSGYLDRPNCVNYDTSVTPVLINATDGEVLQAKDNYTFTTRINPTTSLKNLAIFSPAASVRFNGTSVNASYVCLPQGYAEDSASRTIIPLVILFASLAVLVFIFVYVMKSGVINY